MVALVGAVVTLVGTGCFPDTPPGPVAPVASVTVDGEVVSARGPVGSRIALSVADPDTLPATPADVDFPVGAVLVELTSVAPGSTVTVTVQVQSAIEMIRAYFGLEWDPFADDGTTGAQLSAAGTTITLRVTDGGRGDADGAADGSIDTVVAPANPSGGGTPAGCYRAAYPFGADVKVIGPPDQVGNLESYLTSYDGTCSGTPRPAAEEYGFYVTAATSAEALGVDGAPGACELVWGSPIGLAQPFATAWVDGPAGYFVCLGTPPIAP